MNKQEENSFYSSYGKQTSNGQYKTLQEIRKGSFLSKLQTTFKMTIFIVMLLSCFWCIYTIDYKEDSKNVGEAAKKAADYTKDIVHETLNTGHDIKEGVQKKIGEVGESIEKLDEEYHVSQTVKENYDSAKDTIKEKYDSAKDTIKENYESAKNKVKDLLDSDSDQTDEQTDSDDKVIEKEKETVKVQVNPIQTQDI